MAKQFLVRVKAENCEEVRELFGKVTYVDLESQPQERAFVTDVMSEKEFADCYAKLTGAINRIRIA
jgi:hypothetical protein